MMDDVVDNPDLSKSDKTKGRADVVDLGGDSSLAVDISDALSEKDKVKFTVHTKTTLPEFNKQDFSVTRQHEEFIWLHDVYEDNEDYAGIVIPPAPPRPDFDASREKLQRLGEGEGTMTKEEFAKMKQELEAEYLATFKKTVAMHEVFLQRIAAHPLLRNDTNFKVFLEYESELSVRGKNRKERLSGFFKTVSIQADEVLLSNQKDTDEFFEHQRQFLMSYFIQIKDAMTKADRMTKVHKDVADSYIKISGSLIQIATMEKDTDKSMVKFAEALERLRKLEGRVASDEDLKLSDTLRYYMRDTTAAKNLLYRRLRALANHEAAVKQLDKARSKNKDVQSAEELQQGCKEKFEKISEVAQKELTDFKTRRIAHFKKNLLDLVELELKHARAEAQLLKAAVSSIKEDA